MYAGGGIGHTDLLCGSTKFKVFCVKTFDYFRFRRRETEQLDNPIARRRGMVRRPLDNPDQDARFQCTA